MDVSSLAPTAAGGNQALDNQKAFREADFLKIMLAEISQQDPFKPQETSKIVEGMQKLQDLANSKFEKFRQDQRWAQDITGQSVSVQQMYLSDKEADALVDKGLNPGRGFQTVTGTVTSFRVVEETVYVKIDDKDYAIDNVRQVTPPTADGRRLAEISNGLLGLKVGWWNTDRSQYLQGTVSEVKSREGETYLAVNGSDVRLSDIDRIGLL